MELWATWCSGRCPCSWQGGWNQVIFKVPSNPNHSMILWTTWKSNNLSGCHIFFTTACKISPAIFGRLSFWIGHLCFSPAHWAKKIAFCVFWEGWWGKKQMKVFLYGLRWPKMIVVVQNSELAAAIQQCAVSRPRKVHTAFLTEVG